MKIFDCFMYSDENMLLDIRMNTLAQFVDKYVIVEARYTHDGKPKKLNFDIKNFSKFKDKIEYVIVNKQPPNLMVEKKDDPSSLITEKKIINSIRRDNYQRNQILSGLNEATDEDLIIISDLDEIPNLLKLNRSKIKNEVYFFKQKMFYYKLNLYYENYFWFGSRATKKKNLKSPQWIRNLKSKKYSFWRIDTFFSEKKHQNINFIDNGGWHFTCIKTPEEIEKKLLSFAHHIDFENAKLSIDHLKDKIKNKIVLYDHSLDKKQEDKWNSKKKLKKISMDELPDYINNNKNKYIQWLEN